MHAIKQTDYSEFFWNRLEDWCLNNPPYRGINWKCGQETAFRLIACLFGYHAFQSSQSMTQERFELFLRFVHASTTRIERNIGYAVSQKNNHGISEAALLWAVGTLFPEFKDAPRWRKVGSRILGELCEQLIYEDGGFCQHSANYHRLLLHILAWTVRLDQVNQSSLPDIVSKKFALATEFMIRITDPVSGITPRYGSDDGALLFPFCDTDYSDYRPVTQLSCAVLDRDLPWKNGVWDEDLAWFGIHATAQATHQKIQSLPKVQFQHAGCHVMRDDQSSAMIRAGNFIHRPTQLDMFHVDINHQGVNVAIDPGTYSYNGDGVWRNNPLARQEFHNTVSVDGKEPSRQVGKFLFLPWNQCSEIDQTSRENLVGFQRKLSTLSGDSAIHRRWVAGLHEDQWLVVDHVKCQSDCECKIHWLLADSLVRDDSWDQCDHGNKIRSSLRLQCNQQDYFVQFLGLDGNPDDMLLLELVRGCDHSLRGWYAPYYLDRQPANSVSGLKRGNDLWFVTYFGPQPADQSKVSNQINQLVSQSESRR